jgi:radical SAM-linked protein
MFRRTGITIAAEAGTLRLRNVINKDVTDDEIFQAVELALRNKWQKIKMYFMFGLPTETMEDIEGIVRLIRQVLKMAKDAKQKIKLHTSFSSFVPKPHTPLQWAKREALTGLREKIGYIKANLKGIRNLDLDVHVPHNGVVETILARGDYRVGELLLKAFAKGEIFSAWDADFNYPVWEEMIYNSVYEEFLSEFSLDETLPWDFLQVNFKKDYMKKEYQKALAAVPTPSCAQRECKDCSGCIYTMKQPEKEKPLTREITQLKETGFDEKPGKPVDMVYNKTRIFYEKTGDFIFFSQLTMMKYIERLIRKSGLVFKCSGGFTPRIKIMSLPPLPVFATGLDEVVEIFVDASLKEGEILERLNRSAAPEGLTFKSVVECNDTPPLSRDIHFMGYEIIVKDLPQHIDDIAQHLGETDFASFSDNRLILTMDYSKQGQERFAKIYKIIDPGKERTMYLTRTHVKFRS